MNIPIYNFSKHAREEKTKTIYGANVIIFEGIYGLHDKRIRDLMDLKVIDSADAHSKLVSEAGYIDICGYGRRYLSSKTA